MGRLNGKVCAEVFESVKVMYKAKRSVPLIASFLDPDFHLEPISVAFPAGPFPWHGRLGHRGSVPLVDVMLGRLGHVLKANRTWAARSGLVSGWVTWGRTGGEPTLRNGPSDIVI